MFHSGAGFDSVFFVLIMHIHTKDISLKNVCLHRGEGENGVTLFFVGAQLTIQIFKVYAVVKTFLMLKLFSAEPHLFISLGY